MSESDKSIDTNDVNKLFLDSLSKGVDSLGSHRYKEGEETKKLFGFLELDSAIANMVEVAYNTFIGGATRVLKTGVYGTIQKHGAGHLGAEPLNRLAAGVSFAVNAGVYALPSITDAYTLWGKQHDANLELIRQLSPVLDELKGKHGVRAYNSVSIEQNEMIAHHRWRTAKINHTRLTNLILPAVAKIAPNIWFHERDTLNALKSGKKLGEVENARLFHEVAHHKDEQVAVLHEEKFNTKLSPDDVTVEHVEALYNDPNSQLSIKKLMKALQEPERKNPNEGFNMGGFGGNLASNATLTTIANKLVESSTRRLQQSFPSDYTALDMVLNLEQQLGSSPTPRSFQLPNKKSAPLEAYIAEIMLQHQRDMANMNPNYAVIRDALRENALAAARPLAAALSKGDISALSLVNYIGSGKIIRNKGRLIASADEVEAMIEHDAGKHVVQVAVDPKDFWSDAPYTEKEGKEAFAALQGEERQLAIALVPHTIRKQFGIAEKEGKEVDAAMAKDMDRKIAEAVLGINELDDDALRLQGLAKVEIAQFREAAKRIEGQGEAAVHDLKSSATNTNGIERALLGVTVGYAIKNERKHLGKLLENGHEKLGELEGSPDQSEHTHARHENHRRTRGEQASMDLN